MVWHIIARNVGTGNIYKILVTKPENYCLGNRVMYGKIIWKFMVKKIEGMRARFVWLRIWISGGFLSTGRGQWRVLVDVV